MGLCHCGSHGGEGTNLVQVVGEHSTYKDMGGFQGSCVRQFQSELVQNPFEILVGIKQDESVREFHELFKMYSQALKISEHRYLLGLFLNGLKDEVRAQLKLHSFHTLDQLMN